MGQLKILCLPGLGSLRSGSWQQRRTMSSCLVLTAGLLHFAKTPLQHSLHLSAAGLESSRLCFAWKTKPEPKRPWSLKKVKKQKLTSNYIFLRTEGVKKQGHDCSSTQEVHFSSHLCKQMPWSSPSSPEGQGCHCPSDKPTHQSVIYRLHLCRLAR